MDKLAKHRNNELREPKIVVGELTAIDDTPVANTEYVVCTVPFGAVVTDVYVVSKAAGNVTATVKLNGTDHAITTAAGVGSVQLEELMPTQSNVSVTLGADVQYGRVLVGVKYVDFDVVNGDRVERA